MLAPTVCQTYDGREGPSRSEPDAMAMKRLYNAMLKNAMAMKRCYDAMERCHDAMPLLFIESYHRFIAIAPGSERDGPSRPSYKHNYYLCSIGLP